MRVASNSFSDSLVRQLNNLNSKQARLQLQASTGKRLRTADDDPTTAGHVLDLQTSTARTEQFRKNLEYQTEIATASMNGIKGLKQISDRASEIATLADGTKSPDELHHYAAELDQLIKQGLQWANSKYDGNALFGGTQTGRAPFAATETNGTITAIDYQGDANLSEVSIGENTMLSAQTVGANSTGTGPRGLIADSRSGADFFKHLIALRDHLQAGNASEISKIDVADLGKDEDNFIYHIGLNGLMQSRLETSSKLVTTTLESNDQALTKETSSDLAETLVHLNETTNAYQAALQSGGSLLKLSLMDYIR